MQCQEVAKQNHGGSSAWAAATDLQREAELGQLCRGYKTQRIKVLETEARGPVFKFAAKHHHCSLCFGYLETALRAK